MSRELVPLQTHDLSGFARALARELGEAAPSHLSLMNMLARSAGFRNYQHLRADSQVSVPAAGSSPSPPEPNELTEPDSEIDRRRLQRALNHFDEFGRLVRWPTRNAVQKLVVWVFWADLPRGKSLTEAQVNLRFSSGHAFADPATLRRMLVGLGRVEREADGSSYTRVEVTVPADAQELIELVGHRRVGSISPTS